MSTKQFDEDSIFAGALQRRSAGERAAYLDGACAGNDALRARVEALLFAHEKPDSLLDKPLVQKPPTTVAQAADLEQPGTQIDCYKLLQKIGEGGFGVVYMAEQKAPVKRRVALKIVKLGMDTKQVVARFESEQQALALMDHPNVAKVLDAGSTDTGRPYFVMELVKGVNITRYCDDNRLTTNERLDLFVAVCNAVQHAHLKGIIHRDIKPSNILITMHDGVPVPKVIDFGVAKATLHELTEKTLFTEYGQFIGTPAYMSPEQAEMSGLDIDTRTDVYSLGVLLYELLVGRTPIDDRELRSGGYDEMRRRIREEEAPKPSTRVSSLGGEELTTIAKHRQISPGQLSSELKGDLDWIVLKALEKDRTRRYESARGLAEDIGRHLESEPILAAAPSTAYRVRKYVQRHKVALAVAATIAGLLVVGTVTSSVLAVLAHRQRQLAQEKEAIANDAVATSTGALARAEAAQQEAERFAYESAMALAPSDWEHGSIARLRETLEKTASYRDLGFEWYYWQHELHPEGHSVNPSLGPLYGLRLGPKEMDVLVTSGQVDYLVDADTGKVLAAYGRGLASADGNWLADGLSGMENGTTLIHVATGRRTNLDMVTAQAEALSFDGRHLATFNAKSHKIQIWDTQNRRGTVAIDLEPGARGLHSSYFSPDGSWIAADVWGAGPNEIHLWSTSDGVEAGFLDSTDASFLGFTPDGARLACLDYDDSEILLHDTTDLTKTIRLRNEGIGVESIAFSPDGLHVAIATNRNAIVIKEVESGRTLSAFRGHKASVMGLAFSRDGRRVFTCSVDGTITTWPAVDNRYFFQTEERVRHVGLSSEGTRILAVAGKDARLIDVRSKGVIATFPDVSGATLTPDGNHVVYVPHEGEGRRITASDDNGREKWSIQFDADTSVRGMFAAPDSERVFVGLRDSFGMYDLASGDVVFRRQDDGTRLSGVGFSFDGSLMALSFRGEDRIQLCDMETGREVDSIPTSDDEHLGWLEFSPDGRHILATYANASSHGVSIYDVARKERIDRFTGHTQPVFAALYSPDSRRIFTRSNDGSVRLWDAKNGTELLSLRDPFGGSLSGFGALAVDSSGRMVAIGGAHGVVLKQAATPEQVAAWNAETELSPANGTDWWRRLGGVQDWLVAGPIPLSANESHEHALDLDQLRSESAVEPRAGEVVQIDEQELMFRKASIFGPILNLDEVYGLGYDNCLAYAVGYIYSDRPQKDVRLLVGSDDLAKVYFNGVFVYTYPGGRSVIPGDDEVAINLEQGRNVLIFKVIDKEGNWGASAQVVGADYQPIPGVTTGILP